jgi:hypothetical protein
LRARSFFTSRPSDSTALALVSSLALAAPSSNMVHARAVLAGAGVASIPALDKHRTVRRGTQFTTQLLEGD